MPLLRSFRARFLIGMVVVEAIAFGLVYYFTSVNISSVVAAELATRANSFVQMYRSALLRGFIANDNAALDVVSTGLLSQSDVTRIEIIDRGQRLIRFGAKQLQPGNPGVSNDQMLTNVPITVSGVTYGQVRVWLANDTILNSENYARFHVMVVAVSGIAALGVLSYILFIMLARPLVRLQQAADAVARGDYGNVIDDSVDNEIGAAIRSFNLMSLRLKEVETVRQQDESTLRHMIGSFPGIGIIYSHTRKPEFVSDRTLIILGAPRDAMLSGSVALREFIHPADQEIFDSLTRFPEGCTENTKTVRLLPPGMDNPLWFRFLVRRHEMMSCVAHKLFFIGLDVTLEHAVRFASGLGHANDAAVAISVWRDAVLMIDEAGNVLSANPAATHIFASEHLVATRASRLLPTVFNDSGDGRMATNTEFLSGGFIETLGRKSGTTLFPVEVYVQKTEGDAVSKYIAIVRDITETKRHTQRAAAYQQRLGIVVNTVKEAVISFNQIGEIDVYNDAAESMFGYREEEVVRLNISDLIPLPRGYANYGDFMSFLVGVGEFEVSARKNGGGVLHLNAMCRSHVLDGQPIVILLATLVDTGVTEAWMSYVAQRDGVTGLYNRNVLLERMTTIRTIPDARPGSNSVVLASIDQCHGQTGRTRPGWLSGVLRAVSATLVSRVPRGHVVARINDNEFAILLYGYPFLRAFNFTESLRLAIAENPVSVDGVTGDVRVTACVVGYPYHDLCAEDLLVLLRTQVAIAQRGGGNTVVSAERPVSGSGYSPLVWTHAGATLSDESQFSLAYQPVVDHGSGDALFYDVLFRHSDISSHHTVADLFSPDRNDADRIRLDRWILRESIGALTAQSTTVDYRIALKLTMASIYSRNILDLVKDTLRFTGVDPHRLLISICVDYVTNDNPFMRAFMRSVKEIGCGVVIDGCRLNVVPVAYLHGLPIDFLKLDVGRSFGGFMNEDGKGMILSAIRIAHSVGVPVVASFVESEVCRQFLHEHGCRIIQGYVVSPPVAAPAMFSQ
jgi:diguanylate cyclase (GGDEF)-like protein/PAS domain S-box-containing protein